jgi:hypothetical protein
LILVEGNLWRFRGVGEGNDEVKNYRGGGELMGKSKEKKENQETLE